MQLIVEEIIVSILYALTLSALTMILEVGITIITVFQMCRLRQKVFIFQVHMLVITELINLIQCSPKT